MRVSALVCHAVVGRCVIFIARCGVPSCCQHHYEQMGGVVRGEEKTV